MPLSRPPSRAIRSRRGFSLMELAIVLAVVGIIIAGIWTYAASAWQSAYRQQAIEQVTAIVTGVRSAYLGGVGVSGAYEGATVTGGLTQQAVLRNAVPSQYVRTTGCTAAGTNGICVDNPWGPSTYAYVSPHGSLGACAWIGTLPNTVLNPSGNNACPINVDASPPPAAQYQIFAVELQGLSTPDCIALATQLSGPQGPSGLLDVDINGYDMLGTVGTSGALPVTVKDAETYCPGGLALRGGPVPFLDFIYRLRAPAF